jgi:hypothetical protein
MSLDIAHNLRANILWLTYCETLVPLITRTVRLRTPVLRPTDFATVEIGQSGLPDVAPSMRSEVWSSLWELIRN